MTYDALEPLETSPAEIAELFARHALALSDARLAAQSADGRYVDAYTAGFLLAKIVVRASGFRVRGGDNHRDTYRTVPWLMGSDAQPGVDVLDAARKKRNADLYDGAGMVDDLDVDALLHRVAGFESLVRAWLAKQHPELLTEVAAD